MATATKSKVKKVTLEQVREFIAEAPFEEVLKLDFDLYQRKKADEELERAAESLRRKEESDQEAKRLLEEQEQQKNLWAEKKVLSDQLREILGDERQGKPVIWTLKIWEKDKDKRLYISRIDQGRGSEIVYYFSGNKYHQPNTADFGDHATAKSKQEDGFEAKVLEYCERVCREWNTLSLTCNV